MKVCFLTTSYPRFAGDYAGVFIFELALWLTKNGVSVDVVAPSEVGVPKVERNTGIRVARFRYMFPEKWQRIAYLGGIPSNLRRYWLAWLQLPFFFLSYAWTAYQSARECDLIHAHWISSGFVATFLSALLSKPVVLTVHGSDVNLMFENRFLGLLRKQVTDRVGAIIAVSKPLARRVQSLNIAGDRVTVIPNGVDISNYEYRDSSTSAGEKLIWVGRMSTEKGLKYLLDAMPQLLKVYPDVKLSLVGDGPLRPEVERTIRKLGIAKSVILTGMVSHEQVPVYLRSSAIFVMPSLSEGLPLVMLEAMSIGLPVVATWVGGVPDVVIGEGANQTGLMVPPEDADALASALIELLDDPALAKKLGMNGRSVVETDYTWQKVAQETISVYNSLL